MVRAAEAALAERKHVTAIDVLVGLGWLTPRRVDEWRQGRVDYLEPVVEVGLGNISTAMRFFRRWARERGLAPSETSYVARPRGRQQLRFSKSGDPAIERAYRTHWVSPELSEATRARLAERQSKPPDLVVISPVKERSCSSCGGDGEFLIMDDPGPLCMACAEMDHLVFLASGDAALTDEQSEPVGSRQWSFGSAAPAVATSAKGSSSRSRHSNKPKRSASPTSKLASGAAYATLCDVRRKTSSCKRRGRPRSTRCSPDALPSAQRRSRGTPRLADADESDAPPPAAPSRSRRSSLPSSHQSVISTRPTTTC